MADLRGFDWTREPTEQDDVNPEVAYRDDFGAFLLEAYDLNGTVDTAYIRADLVAPLLRALEVLNEKHMKGSGILEALLLEFGWKPEGPAPREVPVEYVDEWGARRGCHNDGEGPLGEARECSDDCGLKGPHGTCLRFNGWDWLACEVPTDAERGQAPREDREGAHCGHVGFGKVALNPCRLARDHDAPCDHRDGGVPELRPHLAGCERDHTTETACAERNGDGRLRPILRARAKP